MAKVFCLFQKLDTFTMVSLRTTKEMVLVESFLMRMRVKATCFLMKKPKSLRKLQETSGSKYSERRDSGRESTKMI